MKFGICRLHHILLPVNLQRIAQMDKQPPVTALRITDYENVELSSWLEPFEELLLLVKIIDRRGDDTRYQEFRFRHTHDLSKISDVFLYLDVDEGVRYSIDLHTFCFPPEHQGRTWVVQLEQYANGVLSRFRVSVFTHRAVGILTQRSDENLGLPQPIDRRQYHPP